VFDLSLTKLMVLAIIAIVIFGPDQLPKVAAQAGLGPEFQDFDIADLHPRNFVRKHLLDEPEPDPVISQPTAEAPYTTALAPGETPPYDSEAT